MLNNIHNLSFFHHIHLLKNEISEIYLNLIIQSFGISLISVFVPIYLLNLGFTLNQALIFVMIELGTLSLFSPFAVMMAQKWGFKHIVVYRLPLMIFYFAALYSLGFARIPLYIIALSGGISSSMYWVSIHALFAKYSNKAQRGRQAGKLISIPSLCSLAGPTLGGVIAASFGFKALIAFAMIILSLAAVPLFFTEDLKPFAAKLSFFRMLSIKQMKFILQFAAQGAIAVAGAVMWPIFVYFALNDLASVGFAATIGALGIVIFTEVVGRVSDKASKARIIKAGGILMALTFFLRIYATGIESILAVSLIAGFFSVLIDLPLLALFYDTANNESLSETVILRELGLGIGRIGIILIMIYSANKFALGFSLGGIASLIFSLV